MICVKVAPIVSTASSSRELPLHTVDVPCSKYVANRLLVIAALARGRSFLREVPQNEDITSVMLALKAMRKYDQSDDFHGENIRFDGDNVTIQGADGCLYNDDQHVYTSDNGTLSRIMAPLLLLSQPLNAHPHSKKDKIVDEGYILSGSPQMNQRPMKDLFLAMTQLGAEVEYQSKEGYLPVKIKGRYRGGECFLSGNVSSQYFSALLLSAPYAENDVIIHATSPLISFSYVEMTMQCMREAGAEVRWHSRSGTSPAALPSFYVVGGRKKVYQGFEKTIETDPSAASYFMAMSSLRFMRLRIERFPRDSVQGEVNFYKILEKIGCQIHFYEIKDTCTLEIIPPPANHSYPAKLEFDISDMTDVGPTILVLAVALGHLYGVETNICGVAHLRYKESNRVEGMSGELRKIGAKIDIGQENIRVLPVTLQPKVARENPLNSLGDHRLVMSFSLLSLITGCVFIENEESVNKTFPHFFEILKKLGFTCMVDEKKSDE